MEGFKQRIYLVTQCNDYSSILHVRLLFVYLPRCAVLYAGSEGRENSENRQEAWKGQSILEICYDYVLA